MIDEIEKRLNDVTARGAPPELREQVLARVAEVLDDHPPMSPVGSCPRERGHATRPKHWRDASGTRRRRILSENRLAGGVAAALLLSIGLNFAAIRIGDMRQAAYQAPPPKPVSVQEMTLQLARADSAEGDSVEDYLRAARWARRSRSGENTLRQYQKTLKKYLILAKEPNHAISNPIFEEVREMGVHFLREPPGNSSGCQRLLRLDHRFTA